MRTELYSVAGRSGDCFIKEVSEMESWTLLEQLDEEHYLLEGAGEWKGLFARHRYPLQLDRTLADAERLEEIAKTVLEGMDLDGLNDGRFGFQLGANWRLPWRFGEFCQELLVRSGLPQDQYEPRRPEKVLSVRLHRGEHGVRLMAGCSNVESNLSPWAGGECRIPRDPDSVSRAEAKLLEAWEAFSLGEVRGRALDLGAAPGGWSRILAGKGLSVDAVDPAALHESVLGLPNVFHQRTTAGDFLAQEPGPYQFVVCDMKMEAKMTAELLLRVKAHLAPEARVLTTLKLKRNGGAALAEARKALDTLRRGYTVRSARQLFFNRSEVTVLM